MVVSRAGTTFDFVKVLDLAPEVVLGAAETDHRVDLYALGCVAYSSFMIEKPTHPGQLFFSTTKAVGRAKASGPSLHG